MNVFLNCVKSCANEACASWHLFKLSCKNEMLDIVLNEENGINEELRSLVIRVLALYNLRGLFNKITW